MYVISQPFLFESVLAQGQGGALPSRDQIEAKYKWDLTPVYESIDLWEQDFAWVKGKTAGYAAFQGKLGSSARSLLEFLKYDEEIGIKFGRVHLYAFLSKDLDLADTKYQALYDRTMGLATQLSEASAFFRPELLSIPEAKLKDYLSEEKGLAVYEHMLNELLRSKDHTLDKEKEELLAMASQVTRVPYDVFGMFKNADIQFPTVADENGQEIQVSDGRYYAALYSNDRSYRERVYRAYYKPFNDYKNTLTAMFNGNLKSLNFSAKARKYSSDRAAALDENNIPLSVYDNLVNSAYNNTSPLHRWCEMKKKVLGLPDMHAYDTYVTLFPSVSKDYSYDEGVELVLKALAPLGEDYIKSLKTAFDNRWIDVYETKGKRSGAYSSGTTFGVHPYVLLNWNNQLNDVFTLAHEMGHNMHSYYTGLNQPYPYANYSIFVAEVASTMNEALLLDYLIEHASTKEEKLSLIEKNLNNITTTFYRQTRFAQYEQMVHEKTEKGEPLTADLLSDMYGELYQAYWGPGMIVDEEEKLTWTRIPHFYYNFYVYQYATSFAASQALAEKVKIEGKPAIEKYLKFLQSGSSVYPIDVLQITGVDMTSEETIMAVVKKMNSLLDQMEQLLNE
ncbi:MAG: oligoendopeptidase F [Ignavibacteriales bacterium]|nr:oligoendopeptidase F [Ignavibacteriales bacterium]MCF8316450.1 oligoendopeptidase F [Ignavibacteriales bacterium]MCF8437930.1 oligoendopeptidase F [Ignavibacteriales bacterium]